MSDCGCVENNLNFSPRIGLAYQAHAEDGDSLRLRHLLWRAQLWKTRTARASSSAAQLGPKSVSPPTSLFSPALIVSQGFPAGLVPDHRRSSKTPPSIRRRRISLISTRSNGSSMSRRQLPGQIVVTASYMGEGGRDMAFPQNLNTPLRPGPGTLQNRRPWPFFSSITLYPAGANFQLRRPRPERRKALLQRPGFHCLLYLVA